MHNFDKITLEQRNNLQALYVNLHALRTLDYTETSQAQVRNNIQFLFKVLDDLGVNFRVQNLVMGLADRKSNIDIYFDTLLHELNIKVIK